MHVVTARVGQRVFANTQPPFREPDDASSRTRRQVSTGSSHAAFEVVLTDVVGALRAELDGIEARRSSLLNVLDTGVMNDVSGEVRHDRT